MADQPPKDQPPTPAKPTNIPKPGTVPKLPQTIFNMEKPGGAVRRDSGVSRPRPGRG
jgi:hypothetical protein